MIVKLPRTPYIFEKMPEPVFDKINELVGAFNDIEFDRSKHDIEIYFEDGTPATITGFATSKNGLLIVKVKK